MDRVEKILEVMKAISSHEGYGSWHFKNPTEIVYTAVEMTDLLDKLAAKSPGTVMSEDFLKYNPEPAHGEVAGAVKDI